MGADPKDFEKFRSEERCNRWFWFRLSHLKSRWQLAVYKDLSSAPFGIVRRRAFELRDGREDVRDSGPSCVPDEQ